MASNFMNGKDQVDGMQPESHSQGNKHHQVLTRDEPIGSSQVLSGHDQASTSVPRPRGRPRIKPLVYGPTRKRGRPRKATSPVSQQRPTKKVRKDSPASRAVSITLGKFRVPGTQLRDAAQPERLLIAKPNPREEPPAQPRPLGSSTTSVVNGVLHPPLTPHPPHHVLIEDEDPNREVEDLNDEDLEGEGVGLGVDEGIYGNDDDDNDDDTDDSGGMALEDGEDSKRNPSHIPSRPLPQWLMDPFNAAIDESKQRDGHGLPPLYQKSTFWFPTPAPYFLLRSHAHVLPQTLYNPRLFLWDPLALYRIPCPRCKKPLNRHSHIRRPCRCVDLNSTFWIIGYRYRCRYCTNPRTGRQTVTYRSWDPRIMESLPPELAAEFPACLSFRSGMSKQLFELMRSTFQNGVGSGQFADLLRVQHLLAYDALHLQYLNHLVTRQESLDHWRGATFTSFLPFDDLSPQGRHGYTPSSAWLRDMYDRYIELHQKEFNQHMSMLTGKICAIDHSHKVTKHVARVEGEQVFTALLTVTNEKGEIRVCNFVATKSHSQFEDALTRMNRSLDLYGHRQPLLFYTDNMADKYLLETSFPLLRNNVVPLEKYANYDPLVVPADVQVFTKDSTHSIDLAISTILNDVPDDHGEIVVGFDMEWDVELSPQGFVRSTGKAAVIQIAYKQRIYVLQISEILSSNKLPHQLELFLLHPRIRKVGRLVGGDLSNLQKACNKPPGSFLGALDIAKLAKDRHIISNIASTGLSDLIAIVLGKRLNKNVPL